VFLYQNPDTKCAECSTSLFPEEVHWLEWSRFPYLLQEARYHTSERFMRFCGRDAEKNTFLPPHCTTGGAASHELSPDWNIQDTTPYGHDVSVCICFEAGMPMLSVCKHDCRKRRAERWFHPPRNTALMWPSHSEGRQNTLVCSMLVMGCLCSTWPQSKVTLQWSKRQTLAASIGHGRC